MSCLPKASVMTATAPDVIWTELGRLDFEPGAPRRDKQWSPSGTRRREPLGQRHEQVWLVKPVRGHPQAGEPFSNSE